MLWHPTPNTAHCIFAFLTRLNCQCFVQIKDFEWPSQDINEVARPSSIWSSESKVNSSLPTPQLQEDSVEHQGGTDSLEGGADRPLNQNTALRIPAEPGRLEIGCFFPNGTAFIAHVKEFAKLHNFKERQGTNNPFKPGPDGKYEDGIPEDKVKVRYVLSGALLNTATHAFAAFSKRGLSLDMES
jgi:hypothetical protein